MEVELHSFLTSALDGGGGVNGNFRTLKALFTETILTGPLNTRLGGSQSPSGRVHDETSSHVITAPNPLLHEYAHFVSRVLSNNNKTLK